VTLQERLDAAHQQRRLAAGLPVEDLLASPPDPDPVLDLRPVAPVIDLRPVPTAPNFSSAITVVDDPGRCPTCSGSTRLDMQDVVGGVDHYSCELCGHLFQVAR
jgi:hypothetical protein